MKRLPDGAVRRRPRSAGAVLLTGLIGLLAAVGLLALASPGVSPASAQVEPPTTDDPDQETTTSAPPSTTEQSTTTTEASPVPTTRSTTTTTVAPTTTAPPTTAAPTTQAPETTPPPPPPPPTTTTTLPPPPPPEDRTPPRQPGQAPTPQDDPQSQAITTQGAEVHPAFPLLSIGGFAALGGLLGAQWYMTKPDRRGRRTL